jgi:hypothetical protein
MRVPTDPTNPTYDQTFTVGFWRWLTSSAAERKEWARRRNAATPTSRSMRKLNQAEQWAARKQAEQDTRRTNPNQ